MRGRRVLRGASPVTALLLLAAVACGGPDAETATEGRLTGLFRITAGACAEAGVTQGTYFRMVQPGGAVGEGPYVTNTDSPCGDQTFTPMAPGSDGGLLTGDFQSHPDPAFDPGGNGAASRITAPTKWFGVAYSLTTNQKDPQTGVEVQAPSLVAAGRKLSGDLRAFAAAWNGQHFNQGSPKPDGAKPGNTSEVTGTYDPSTKAFTLDWTSQIVGGPFNNFTGTWHFEGIFEPGANAT